MKLDSKVFVITGGSSGLGLATTLMVLAKYKAKVAVFDLDDKGLAVANKVFKDSILFCKVDVTNEEQVKEAFQKTIEKWQQVNVLVNCAGIGTPSKILQKDATPQPIEKFKKVIDINLTGTMNTIRWFSHHVVKYAQENGIPLTLPPADYDQPGEQDGVNVDSLGVILNVASVAAFEGQIGQSAYAASKSGVVGMTLPLARELAAHRIRINTIAPGVFITPMLRALPKKAQESLSKQVPFPSRLGREEEFAHAAVFLFENEYINGTVVRIDGAMRMAAM